MKIIKTFDNQSLYVTNNKCPLCFQIDNMFKVLIEKDLSDEDYSTKLEFLEQFLVNGYKLIETYEKNGYHMLKQFYDDIIKRMYSYTIESEDINLIYSRWCKECASRKYDIKEET